MFFHAQHGDTPGREGNLVPSLSSAGTGLVLSLLKEEWEWKGL